ncbi:hypothetical protein BHM03_00045810 [Ensete ventricosum]|nr:hypothetical protein BHM03_00045810 [Ensete ventricosum]
MWARGVSRTRVYIDSEFHGPTLVSGEQRIRPHQGRRRCVGGAKAEWQAGVSGDWRGFFGHPTARKSPTASGYGRGRRDSRCRQPELDTFVRPRIIDHRRMVPRIDGSDSQARVRRTRVGERVRQRAAPKNTSKSKGGGWTYEPLGPPLLNQCRTKDSLIITPSTKGGKGSCLWCLIREYWSTEVHGSGPS